MRREGGGRPNRLSLRRNCGIRARQQSQPTSWSTLHSPPHALTRFLVQEGMVAREMKNNMPLMVSSAFFALFLLREGGQNYTTVERHPCTQLLDFLRLRLEAIFLLPPNHTSWKEGSIRTRNNKYAELYSLTPWWSLRNFACKLAILTFPPLLRMAME